MPQLLYSLLWLLLLWASTPCRTRNAAGQSLNDKRVLHGHLQRLQADFVRKNMLNKYRFGIMLDHHSWLSTTSFGCLQDWLLHLGNRHWLIFPFSGKESPTKTLKGQSGLISNDFFWTLREYMGLIRTIIEKSGPDSFTDTYSRVPCST